MNTILIDKIVKYRSLFRFSVNGICEHLEYDTPEKEEIIDTLIFLREELDAITDQLQQEIGVENTRKSYETWLDAFRDDLTMVNPGATR